MAETEKPLKINEILNLLDAANKTLETKIHLPTQVEEVDLAPLNANHTKNIIKSVASGIFSDIQFNLVMYNIIQEVVKLPLTTLSAYDKTVLLLNLRSRNIAPDVEVDVTGEIVNDDGKKENKTIKHKVDIKKHLASLKFLKEFDNEKLEADGYEVLLNFPLLSEEFAFDEHLYKTKLLSIDEENKNALKGLIGTMFVYSVSPYVKALVIKDKTIPLQNKTVDERLAVVEKLSASVTKKILTKIDEYFGKEMQKLTAVSVTKDGVEYTGNIQINSDLFI
jgi:hypothetical protein